jgi:hypothetical protein
MPDLRSVEISSAICLNENKCHIKLTFTVHFLQTFNVCYESVIDDNGYSVNSSRSSDKDIFGIEGFAVVPADGYKTGKMGKAIFFEDGLDHDLVRIHLEEIQKHDPLLSAPRSSKAVAGISNLARFTEHRHQTHHLPLGKWAIQVV